MLGLEGRPCSPNVPAARSSRPPRRAIAPLGSRTLALVLAAATLAIGCRPQGFADARETSITATPSAVPPAERGDRKANSPAPDAVRGEWRMLSQTVLVGRSADVVQWKLLRFTSADTFVFTDGHGGVEGIGRYQWLDPTSIDLEAGEGPYGTLSGSLTGGQLIVSAKDKAFVLVFIRAS